MIEEHNTIEKLLIPDKINMVHKIKNKNVSRETVDL
jgi:hypothetical protein